MPLPLLDKGADLKRNDCVNIYAFRSVRVWGWSWRSGSISFHGRAHSLPPHARTLFYILPTYIRDSHFLCRNTGLLLRGACAPPWFLGWLFGKYRQTVSILAQATHQHFLDTLPGTNIYNRKGLDLGIVSPLKRGNIQPYKS